MKSSHLCFLLVLLTLASCLPFGRNSRKQQREREKALATIRSDRNFASQVIDSATAAFPELVHVQVDTVRDTVRVDSIVLKTEYKDRPVVDSSAIRQMTDRQMSALDSLKLIVADRDQVNRILKRTATRFIEENGLLTRDTMQIDTLGLVNKVWFYKGKLFSEVRVKERKIAYDKAVANRSVQPMIVKDWFEFWQTWVSLAVLLLLLFIIYRLLTLFGTDH